MTRPVFVSADSISRFLGGCLCCWKYRFPAVSMQVATCGHFAGSTAEQAPKSSPELPTIHSVSRAFVSDPKPEIRNAGGLGIGCRAILPVNSRWSRARATSSLLRCLLDSGWQEACWGPQDKWRRRNLQRRKSRICKSASLNSTANERVCSSRLNISSCEANLNCKLRLKLWRTRLPHRHCPMLTRSLYFALSSGVATMFSRAGGRIQEW